MVEAAGAPPESPTSVPAPTATAVVSPTELCERPSPEAVYCNYRVRRGDTLSELAQAFEIKGGEHYTGADVLALNNELDVADNASLWADTVIRVPAATALIHAAEPEETVAAVAGHYGVEVSEIVSVSANRVDESTALDSGRELLVPATPNSLSTLAQKLSEKNTARIEAKKQEQEKARAEALIAAGVGTPENPPDVTSASTVVPHRVTSSDTLSGIAEKYGVTQAAIREANNLDTPDLVVMGRELRIPTGESASVVVPHRVTGTDTLSGLAERYGVTQAAIRAANDLDTPDLLVLGRELRIPIGAAQPAAAAGSAAAGPGQSASAAFAQPPPVVAAAAPEAPPRRAPTPPPNSRPSAITAATVAEVKEEFAAGYRSAGGPESHLPHILEKVIRCESGYNVRAYSGAGPFYGLMQFLESTWNRVGGGDWFSAYQQGVNTARLLKTHNPLTQWPVCWLK
jgi:LysM repeat protein